jgi:hypothetical protein
VLELDKLLSDPYFDARIGPVWRETIKYLKTRKIDFLGTTLFSLPELEKQEGFENVRFVYVGGMEMPVGIYKFWRNRLKEQGKTGNVLWTLYFWSIFRFAWCRAHILSINTTNLFVCRR